MMKSILFICLVFLSSSCSTYDKLKGQAEAFYNKYPADLVELCSNKFPVKDSIASGKTDTVIKTVYSKPDSVPCPAAPGQKPVYVPCPPAKTIYTTLNTRDTVFRENTAKVEFLQARLSNEHDIRIKTETERDQLESVNEKLKTSNIITGLVALVLLFFLVKRP